VLLLELLLTNRAVWELNLIKITVRFGNLFRRTGTSGLRTECLYHHIVTLARDDLQGLFYHTKSLCVSFPDARQNIKILVESVMGSSASWVEVWFVKAYGLIFPDIKLDEKEILVERQRLFKHLDEHIRLRANMWRKRGYLTLPIVLLPFYD
jgi:hypothetical protein